MSRSYLEIESCFLRLNFGEINIIEYTRRLIYDLFDISSLQFCGLGDSVIGGNVMTEHTPFGL